MTKRKQYVTKMKKVCKRITVKINVDGKIV